MNAVAVINIQPLQHTHTKMDAMLKPDFYRSVWFLSPSV